MVSDRSVAKMEATRRLFEAAPALLATLKHVLAIASFKPHHEPDMDDAYDLIARVEGRKS